MSKQSSSQEIKSTSQNQPSTQPLDAQARSSSTSSSSGPVTERADNKAPALVKLKTKDDNDCAFHAVLGAWNDKEQQVICAEAKQRRAEVKRAIEDSKAGSRIRELAVAGIKELIMTGRAMGEGSRQLLQRYQQFLSDQDVLSPQLWQAFEIELIAFQIKILG
jgi:hypothetical protein